MKKLFKYTIVAYLVIVGGMIWLGSIQTPYGDHHLPRFPVSKKGTAPWDNQDKADMGKLYGQKIKIEPFGKPEEMPKWCSPKDPSWDDFIEALNLRGMTIWDPDAQGVWEEYH